MEIVRNSRQQRLSSNYIGICKKGIRLTVITTAAILLLAGCPAPAGSGEVSGPAEPPTEMTYFELILVRDTEHMNRGEAARVDMIYSTMLYQRELGDHLGLYFEIKEYGSAVDLSPDTTSDGTDASDYLSKFRTWKQTNIDDSGTTYQPLAALYSEQEFALLLGLAYSTAQIGTNNSVSVMTMDYADGGERPDLWAALAARYLGYGLGGRSSEHGEAGYILSTGFSSIPTEYHPQSLANMGAAIDQAVASRGALPQIPLYPLSVSIDSGKVTLSWDFGLGPAEYTVYRNTDSIPLSCFDCDTIYPVGSDRQYEENQTNPGTTFRYRVVARDPTGNLLAASNETAVTVP